MSDGFSNIIKSIYSTNKTVETDSNYTVAIFIVVVLSVIIITLLLKNEANIIDKDWDKYRCHPKYVFIGGGGPHNAQPKSPGELLHKSLKSQLRNILSKNHTLD